MDWLTDCLADWLADWMTKWLTGWLMDQLIDPLADSWWTDWMTDGLTDWLTVCRWLINCSNGPSTPWRTTDRQKKRHKEEQPRFYILTDSRSTTQSYVGKKMEVVHITTLPCEPYATHYVQGKTYLFFNIWPCVNDIVYSRFEGFRTTINVLIAIYFPTEESCYSLSSLASGQIHVPSWFLFSAFSSNFRLLLCISSSSSFSRQRWKFSTTTPTIMLSTRKPPNIRKGMKYASLHSR